MSKLKHGAWDILSFSPYCGPLQKFWILQFPQCSSVAFFIISSLHGKCPHLSNSISPDLNFIFLLKDVCPQEYNPDYDIRAIENTTQFLRLSSSHCDEKTDIHV